MERDKLYEIIFGENYYTLKDLRYNQKIGYLLSKAEMQEIIDQKEKYIEEKNKNIIIIPLKTFNSKYCFYVKGIYLLNKYHEHLAAYIDDCTINQKNLLVRNVNDIMMSRLYSEIEGTLKIENEETTHKRIKEIFEKETLTNRNDIIVKNMKNALDFIIKEEPAFTKDNLLKLYKLLSKDCLDEEEQLKEGSYYRHDTVSVGDFSGAPVEMIEEMMDSLFDYVQGFKNTDDYHILLPHICHYYILYVHPYFDYNGRTARMVSFWLNYIYNIQEVPWFMSEAINEEKQKYYQALVNTRVTGNDLTYFLGYIMESALKFNFVYKNIEQIKKALSEHGDFLTSTELMYLKKIIIHNPENYFNCKMFFEYINMTMSKQAGFKILNHLVDYNILIKGKNKKGEIIYKINQEMIVYKIS